MNDINSSLSLLPPSPPFIFFFFFKFQKKDLKIPGVILWQRPVSLCHGLETLPFASEPWSQGHLDKHSHKDFRFAPGHQQNPIGHAWDFAPFSLLSSWLPSYFSSLYPSLSQFHSDPEPHYTSQHWQKQAAAAPAEKESNLPDGVSSREIIENKERRFWRTDCSSCWLQLWVPH